MRPTRHPPRAQARPLGGLRKTVRNLLAGAYPAKEAPNRRYGNRDLIELVSLAMARRSSLADTAEWNSRLSDSDTFHHHLHHCTAAQVFEAFEQTLASLLAHAKALGYLDGEASVAIDRHNEDYYGALDPWVMKKKHEHGTGKAHAYLTSKRIQDPRFTLDLQRLHPLRDQHAALRDLLARTLERQAVGTFYLDKGFYNRIDLALLKGTGRDFVVPAPQDRFIRRQADLLWRGRQPVGQGCFLATLEHQVGEARHGPTPVTLVFEWEPDPTQPTGYSRFVYACPRAASHDQLHTWAKSYRGRWDIETGYRVTEHHRLRSTTTNYPNRLFLSCITFLVDTVWRLLRHALQQRDPGQPLLTMPRFRAALLDLATPPRPV